MVVYLKIIFVQLVFPFRNLHQSSSRVGSTQTTTTFHFHSDQRIVGRVHREWSPIITLAELLFIRAILMMWTGLYRGDTILLLFICTILITCTDSTPACTALNTDGGRSLSLRFANKTHQRKYLLNTMLGVLRNLLSSAVWQYSGIHQTFPGHV